MFKVFAEVQEMDQGLKEIQAAMKELQAHEVLVGIPEEEAARENGDPINNAELLYIHTNGSPVNGIPARPVIEPAIEHNRESIAELLQGASDAALRGDKAGVTPALEKAGMHGQNVARGWFANPANQWQDNDDKTIERKGSNRPLIDDDEMRKSITYKVEKE